MQKILEVVVLSLLHEWVTQHGRGMDQANDLHHIFKDKVKHTSAANEIKNGKQTSKPLIFLHIKSGCEQHKSG